MADRWRADSDHDRAVMSVLEEIRAFTDAVDRMHGEMKTDMEMNATDLAALRMLTMRERSGTLVSPHDLADHLRISTASTTKLLDRLSASGHIERHAHPHDRRARVIRLTEQTREEFFRHFGARLLSMRSAAEPYSDEELRVIGRFLSDMGDALVAG